MPDQICGTGRDGQLSASDQEALAKGCYFDEAQAQRVRVFFKKFIRQSKGEWAAKPFELQPWQWEQYIRPVYGWRQADGSRRFRRVYLEVPKKNGKSTLSAAQALHLLLADGEPGAEVYSAAADRRQAGIVFNETVEMVRQSAELAKRIKLVKSLKRMRVEATGSSYEALSADVPTKEGLNIHGLIFDELHAQQTRKLWETLEYGGAARRQPLFISITTAGDDKDTICWEQHEYAECIVDSKHVDPSYFGLIYAAGEGDDWKDPATWAKANPSLGTTLKVNQFEADCRAAQKTPAKEQSFKRYRLNIWSEGGAAQWLDVEAWDACKGLDPRELLGKLCYGGFDLSATTDLCAFDLFFPEQRALLVFFWMPEEACRQRERFNRPRLDQWVRTGHIKQIPGAYIQQDVLLADVDVLAGQYRIKQIAVDPWNGYDFSIRLRNRGHNPILFKQGFANISAPTKRLQELVLAREIRHDGHPVMRWCVQNCCVDTDANENIRPTKARSRDRIDGVVGGIMAIGSAPVVKKQATYLS